MNKWIARGAVALTVLVSGAGAAFMVLADMGERKLERRVDVAVTPVAFRSDAASIERGATCSSRAAAATATAPTAPATSSSTTARACCVRSPDITLGAERRRRAPTRRRTGCERSATASSPTAGR